MARKIELKPIVVKIIIGVAIFILGLIATCIALQTAHSQRDAKITQEFAAQILDNYKINVSKKIDAYALTKSGLRQLNINLPNLSLISLKRATEIEPNYRDAWLALGLTQLNTGDVKTALISFQTAEKLDPINAKTYELLKIAYGKLEDAGGSQKAEEKWKFLTKK